MRAKRTRAACVPDLVKDEAILVPRGETTYTLDFATTRRSNCSRPGSARPTSRAARGSV
jgi:hypothetical protein